MTEEIIYTIKLNDPKNALLVKSTIENVLTALRHKNQVSHFKVREK